MERKHYHITIDAPAEKVWEKLWSDEGYRDWTTAFSPGSHAKTDFKKGSKVLFLDAKETGMVARVEENIPNSFMSFEHLGEYKDGFEDLDSPQVKQWAGAHENYTLTKAGDKTELEIDVDITPEFTDMFDKMWPKALARLKEISEQ